MRKILLITIFVFLSIGLFGYTQWQYKPVSIDILFDRILLKGVIRNPELLSQLRLLEPLGIT